MKMDCIKLRVRFGNVYRITFDPAYDHRGVPRRKLDPWYMQLPCRFGTIYPLGGDKLAVEVDYHPGIAKRLGGMAGVALTQDGDHEKTFAFRVELLDAVADVVRPKRRSRRSAAQIAHTATLTALRLQKAQQMNQERA
jgi:hypothetical protein